MRSVLCGLVGAVLAANAAQAAPVSGTYTGKGSEPAGFKWDLNAKIAPADAGRFKVQVTSTNSQCASQTDGTGTLRGRTLTVGGSCPLTIHFKGRTARIIEGENCDMHGATCTFSGSLRMER